MHEQIIEMFKNKVSQRKMGRDLDILPSTVHNIIKRFKESGGISAPSTSLGSEGSGMYHHTVETCMLVR